MLGFPYNNILYLISAVNIKLALSDENVIAICRMSHNKHCVLIPISSGKEIMRQIYQEQQTVDNCTIKSPFFVHIKYEHVVFAKIFILCTIFSAILIEIAKLIQAYAA